MKKFLPCWLIKGHDHDIQPLSSVLRPPSSRRLAGFTLIEMLVVIILIGILAGMVLGLFKISGDWTAKSNTTKVLGKVRAAIEEFYAEYGSYPPVPIYGDSQPFGYEYPSSNQVENANSAITLDNWSSAPVFTFGLMSFLVQRYNDEWQRSGDYHAASAVSVGASWNGACSMQQWKTYNATDGDQPRDKNAVNRWKTMIQDVQTLQVKAESLNGDHVQCYTNNYLTVLDGWNRELHYASAPPYQSYRLWSDGTTTNSTADDVSTGTGY